MKNLTVEIAEKYYREGFTPDVNPAYGCCNFVSHCLKEAGWDGGIINYVPALVEKLEKKEYKDGVAGDLIVFEQTYDAVAPAGIGEEDDMTHVGVYAGEGDFYHFSGGRVKKNGIFEEYWNGKIQFFLKNPVGNVITVANWKESAYKKLKEIGIVTGEPNYDKPMTRAEGFSMIAKVIEYYEVKAGKEYEIDAHIKIYPK